MSYAHASPETGELCLLLQLAATRRNVPLLKQVLRAIAHSCSDQSAKWTLKQAKQFLTPQSGDWLESNLRKLYEDPENQRRLSSPCYLWQRQGTEPLAKEVHTRVTRMEAERLQAIAKTKGMTRAALAREIMQRYLAEVGDAVTA